jgi:FixJ family two-component response regulator
MLEEWVIFVVDDDDAVRDSICMLLESYGVASHSYASGEAFLGNLPSEPGCLLVDVNMPGMNGLQLLNELRGRGILFPVIVMTGELPRSLQLAVDQAGAMLLRKPFRPRALIACLEKALGRSPA